MSDDIFFRSTVLNSAAETNDDDFHTTTRLKLTGVYCVPCSRKTLCLSSNLLCGDTKLEGWDDSTSVLFALEDSAYLCTRTPLQGVSYLLRSFDQLFVKLIPFLYLYHYKESENYFATILFFLKWIFKKLLKNQLSRAKFRTAIWYHF